MATYSRRINFNYIKKKKNESKQYLYRKLIEAERFWKIKRTHPILYTTKRMIKKNKTPSVILMTLFNDILFIKKK